MTTIYIITIEPYHDNSYIVFASVDREAAIAEVKERWEKIESDLREMQRIRRIPDSDGVCITAWDSLKQEELYRTESHARFILEKAPVVFIAKMIEEMSDVAR